MRKSDLWFESKASQDTRSRMATLQVLGRVGPDNAAEPPREKNDKGEKFFKVGESVVGGEEVIG